jgi:hypothetical protein
MNMIAKRVSSGFLARPVVPVRAGRVVVLRAIDPPSPGTASLQSSVARSSLRDVRRHGPRVAGSLAHVGVVKHHRLGFIHRAEECYEGALDAITFNQTENNPPLTK